MQAYMCDAKVNTFTCRRNAGTYTHGRQIHTMDCNRCDGKVGLCVSKHESNVEPKAFIRSSITRRPLGINFLSSVSTILGHRIRTNDSLLHSVCWPFFGTVA